MLPGLILIAFGALLAWRWWAAFVIALKGALILSLFLTGKVLFLIGFARRKARRNYANALRDEPGAAPEPEPASGV